MLNTDPVTLWLRSMRRRNLAPGTIEHRASVARRLADHAHTNLIDVTTDQIEDWLDSRPVSARTRYTDISHVSAFFRWAIREELATSDPTARIDRPKVRAGIPRPIATGDLRYAIAQSPTPEVTAMLHLAAFAGLRCAEIAALGWADINGDMALVHGKGGKDRVVPLHPLILASLRPLQRSSYGSVFGLTATKVSHAIRKHLVACGVVASAHMLRHWFATEVYEASGADLRMTQELLGHSSPTTTAMYTRWSQTRAVDIVSSMTA
jgi:site-specific recombinase XerD